MKEKFINSHTLIIFILAILVTANAHSIPTVKWNLKTLTYRILPGSAMTKIFKIRTGHIKANPQVKYQGNILYLEGLGDSMMNHAPLFKRLSDEGYRIISFDYMGQGGSEGYMVNTRILQTKDPTLQISNLAEIVWDMHKRDSADETKTVIGWSTGGLAAYEMAHRKWADRVVLIAPGICPNFIVGEGFALSLTPINEITQRTLTSAHSYPNGGNPHIDPISPRSPYQASAFAINLLWTSFFTSSWVIDNQVKGLVLLSGDKDTYVDAACTKEEITSNAKSFKIIEYAEALHEIDNEVQNIQDKMQNDIVQFLNIN